MEGFQEGQELRPVRRIRWTFGADELRRRKAINLRVITTVGGRTILFGREPTEPRHVCVPVEASQDRVGPSLIRFACVIVTMMAESWILVIVPVVMAMSLRIAAKLGPVMPVRNAALSVRVTQLEPGQAAEDDQTGKQYMQGVVTRTGHDSIRRSTRRKRPRTPG